MQIMQMQQQKKYLKYIEAKNSIMSWQSMRSVMPPWPGMRLSKSCGVAGGGGGLAGWGQIDCTRERERECVCERERECVCVRERE
jgi:hypothetical protein